MRALLRPSEAAVHALPQRARPQDAGDAGVRRDVEVGGIVGIDGQIPGVAESRRESAPGRPAVDALPQRRLGVGLEAIAARDQEEHTRIEGPDHQFGDAQAVGKVGGHRGPRQTAVDALQQTALLGLVGRVVRRVDDPRVRGRRHDGRDVDGRRDGLEGRASVRAAQHAAFRAQVGDARARGIESHRAHVHGVEPAARPDRLPGEAAIEAAIGAAEIAAAEDDSTGAGADGGEGAAGARARAHPGARIGARADQHARQRP